MIFGRGIGGRAFAKCSLAGEGFYPPLPGSTIVGHSGESWGTLDGEPGGR
jgi:hypothetical protein